MEQGQSLQLSPPPTQQHPPPASTQPQPNLLRDPGPTVSLIFLLSATSKEGLFLDSANIQEIGIP